MTDDRAPAQMTVTPPKRSTLRNVSWIWLVPLLALVVTLGVAWQTYADRGTLITISFQNASGVTEGETTLRYRDVVIGTVESVGFSEDLAEVEVAVRVDNAVVPFLDQDARFWVVRPQVTARGISGLSTVLSGVYIEGAWDQTPGTEMRSFRGTDTAPLVRPGENGTRIVLRTDDGTTITAGAPILYRGVEVGQLEEPRLTLTGDSILVDAFIAAPHDRLITTATRFWDSSGFTVSFGTSGFELDVDSLASLVSGGISFDTIYSGGTPIETGQVFDIYPDESEARRRPFLSLGASTVNFTVRFAESVSGLSNGADVTYRGLQVGQVQALRSELEQSGFGAVLGLKADIAIDPQRMGLPADMSRAAVERFFVGAVDSGLRARLGASGLFGGDLIIELVELPEATPAALDLQADPYPVIPTVESDLPDFATTAQGVLDRIDALPLEELLNQAISVMASIEEVARADGTRQAPDAILGLVEDTRALVASDDTRAIPGELRAAVADLRAIVAELQEQDTVAALADALRSADQVARDLSDATGDLPALIEDLRAVATTANTLPVDELIARANRVLDSADAFISSNDTQQLPAALSGALAQVEAALADLRAGGTVENVNATLSSAREAADAVAQAASDLPQLSTRLNQLVRQAEALVASYGDRSNFNAETLSALRDVSDAARAVSRLARELERNPNSLLFGR